MRLPSPLRWRPRPLALLIAAGALLLAPSPAAQAPAGQAPTVRARNVVVILSDDHAAGVYGAYGNSVVRTPNLDAFAAQGVRFTHAYANSPMCTPSRQSLLTGRMPHSVGVTLLHTALADSVTTLADVMGGRGYRTAAVGKMHFNSGLTHGFDVRVDGGAYRQRLGERPAREVPAGIAVRPPWRPFTDPAAVWLNADGLPEARYAADDEATFLTDRAVEFIEESGDQPFLLWLGYHQPHSPFSFPVEYAGLYDPADMPLPEVGPEDARWVPAAFRDLTADESRGIVRAYYQSVEYLDHEVGRVLGAIDRLGLDESTLVVYLGDHGYLLGDHGRFEKHMMWEPAVRIPLVVRAPGLAPSVSGAMVEGVDLVPTILDVLGQPPMALVQGRSLGPLLRGETDRHRASVFSEYLQDHKAMVRTDRWKYVFTTGAHDLALGYETGFGPPGITHRLYDMAEDPGEQHDLASDPHHSGVLALMQQEMLARFVETHPLARRLPPQLSLEQALVWFTVPPERRS